MDCYPREHTDDFRHGSVLGPRHPTARHQCCILSWNPAGTWVCYLRLRFECQPLPDASHLKVIVNVARAPRAVNCSSAIDHPSGLCHRPWRGKRHQCDHVLAGPVDEQVGASLKASLFPCVFRSAPPPHPSYSLFSDYEIVEVQVTPLCSVLELCSQVPGPGHAGIPCICRKPHCGC